MNIINLFTSWAWDVCFVCSLLSGWGHSLLGKCLHLFSDNLQSQGIKRPTLLTAYVLRLCPTDTCNASSNYPDNKLGLVAGTKQGQGSWNVWLGPSKCIEQTMTRQHVSCRRDSWLDRQHMYTSYNNHQDTRNILTCMPLSSEAFSSNTLLFIKSFLPWRIPVQRHVMA